PDHSFKPHPARRSASVKTEGKRRDQRTKKLCTAGWTQPIANLLQSSRVAAATESVVQGFIADPGFVQLPLGPLMTVDAHPYGKGGIGIGLPERRTPF